MSMRAVLQAVPNVCMAAGVSDRQTDRQTDRHIHTYRESFHGISHL